MQHLRSGLEQCVTICIYSSTIKSTCTLFKHLYFIFTLHISASHSSNIVHLVYLGAIITWYFSDWFSIKKHAVTKFNTLLKNITVIPKLLKSSVSLRILVLFRMFSPGFIIWSYNVVCSYWRLRGKLSNTSKNKGEKMFCFGLLSSACLKKAL